ncbi:MAG: hypothetical protein ACQES1_04590 [Bacteroidota bacterium]
MKKIYIISLILVSSVLLTNCGGSNDSESDAIDEAKEAVKEVKSETGKAIKGAEKNKKLNAEQFGKKVLKAFQENDLETIKEMVQPAMAVNLDEEFIQNKNDKYMQDWDGTVKGVKYRKDDMTGMPHALIYYSDITDDTETEEEGKIILVHVLEKLGDNWYALGGPWGFEEMKKTEFEAFPESIDGLE